MSYSLIAVDYTALSQTLWVLCRYVSTSGMSTCNYLGEVVVHGILHKPSISCHGLPLGGTNSPRGVLIVSSASVFVTGMKS